MKEMDRMNITELENVTGGTELESHELAFLFAGAGYGKYVSADGELDYKGMKSLFASKGFRFSPSEKEDNLFCNIQDGTDYGQWHIEQMILDGSF